MAPLDDMTALIICLRGLGLSCSQDTISDLPFSIPVKLLPPPRSHLEHNRHDQQGPLQTARDDIDPPRAPPGPTHSRGHGARPEETTRRLDQHHGDAQTTRCLQAEGRVQLREVLDDG